jgi:hypothetical protein
MEDKGIGDCCFQATKWQNEKTAPALAAWSGKGRIASMYFPTGKGEYLNTYKYMYKQGIILQICTVL